MPPWKLLAVLGLVVFACWSPAYAGTEATGETPDASGSAHRLWDELRSGLYSRLNIVGFGIVQKPLNSALNPKNILEIPDYQTELDLRPDFNLRFRQLELAVKPRFEGRWQKWAWGVREGSEVHGEAFVQEWLVRYRIVDPLFISYGRENLQWGPAYLLSVSNPFNVINGRNNPQLEVPSLDYGRVVWLPRSDWTASFIANTDKGRLDIRETFKKTYALKLDYTGAGLYFSLIPSYRKDGKTRVGFYGGWNVSEAAMLYTEGQVAEGEKNPQILVGGSYTLQLGPTIGLEYFRNQHGCDQDLITVCLAPSSAGIVTRDALLRQGQDWLRKNYLLLQYLHTGIESVLNVTVRWVRNLDDQSNRFSGIFAYEVGDHLELFLIANVLEGSRKTEFRSVLSHSVMLGASYTF
jgi:hypothetical protein